MTCYFPQVSTFQKAIMCSVCCHRDPGCYYGDKYSIQFLTSIITFHVFGPMEQKKYQRLSQSSLVGSCLLSDLQMMPLEKSHSSPGSSKSSSDGQLRSHGPSRSQSKSSVTQAHLEDAGIAIAAAEAAVQQSCLQPSKSLPYP